MTPGGLVPRGAEAGRLRKFSIDDARLIAPGIEALFHPAKKRKRQQKWNPERDDNRDDRGDLFCRHDYLR